MQPVTVGVNAPFAEMPTLTVAPAAITVFQDAGTAL
jgi:hypothetical protein